MKVVFMGTPDFAVPCLQKLIDNKYDIAAVFTQPDKKTGRKQLLTPPPVKVLAQENSISVYQPASLKNGDAAEIITSINPDIIIVVAYGKILPPSVLSIPKYGCINVHASLLPKYRGAAPIQWAVLNGDSETGVCIMQMDEGLDTGDIISEVKTNIDINETSEQLFDRLSVIGADALVDVLTKIEAGNISPQKQIGESSYASMISRDLSPINWNKSAFDIHNQIRGLNSWPGASTVIAGKQVKIHASLLSDMNGAKPGEIIAVGKDITVSCGDGHCIDITELQPAGKKKMDSKSFAAGNKISVGDIIGS